MILAPDQRYNRQNCDHLRFRATLRTARRAARLALIGRLTPVSCQTPRPRLGRNVPLYALNSLSSKAPAIALPERRTEITTLTESREMCIGESLPPKVSLKRIKVRAGAIICQPRPELQRGPRPPHAEAIRWVSTLTTPSQIGQRALMSRTSIARFGLLGSHRRRRSRRSE